MRQMIKTPSLLSKIAHYRARLLALAITAITGFAVVMPSQAMPSMKSSDFEVVYAGGRVEGECIVDKDYLSSVWDAQLLRARIKNQFRDAALGWLWIDVLCARANHNPNQFVYDIDVVWTWKADENLYPEVALSGMYGIGSEDAIKQYVEDRINDAITEYLKANL